MSKTKTQIALGDFGQTLKEEWPKYGIIANDLTFKGNKVPYQSVIRDGKLVAIFSDRYQVLPNEDAISIGHRLASEYGLVSPEHGPKAFGNGKIKGLMFNRDKTAMTQIFVNPNPENVAPVGKAVDNIYTGIAFRNSIDGSSAFTTSVFTFRQVCENRAMHYARKASLALSLEEGISTRGDAIASLNLHHTKAIKNIDELSKKIKDVLDAGKDILFRYKVMMHEKLMKSQAEILARRMAKVVINDKEVSKWLKVSTNPKTGAIKVNVEDVTLWKAYNDITDVLSHTDKIGYESITANYTLADTVLVRKR